MFLPFTRSTHACISKSIASTFIVSVVRTLLLDVLPVADSVWTFLQEAKSPSVINYTNTINQTILPILIKKYNTHTLIFNINWKIW